MPSETRTYARNKRRARVAWLGMLMVKVVFQIGYRVYQRYRPRAGFTVDYYLNVLVGRTYGLNAKSLIFSFKISWGLHDESREIA